MLINFVDNNITVNLKIQEKLLNKNVEILQPKTQYNISTNISDNKCDFSEVEQLQNKVLNSLNYASSQQVLPSTLPEQLNVKFLNVSTLDKIIYRIISSPIAQLENPNTMYISTNLLPQNQLKYRNNLISKLYDNSETR